MKKIYTLTTGIALLLALSIQLSAQCTGGRYHDLIFPGNPTVNSNINYGHNFDQNGVDQQLYLDVYRPACDVATNRPLIVFAHGGSFMTGDKADAGYAATCISLAKLGYVVASINYRLGFPTSGLAAQYGFNSAIVRGVHDARAAIRFLRDNALNGGNTYGIDPNQIFFSGVSAGGIMALHLAYQNTSTEMNAMACGGQPGTNQGSVEGLTNSLSVSSSVRAIISISGGIRDLNWILNNDIPVCMAHGTVDGTVPYGSGTFGGFFTVHGSSSIATKCISTGTTYCFKPMIGQDHTPTNPAYIDTIATLLRNFLESFVCTTTLNCNYTASPATLTPTVSIAITSGTNPTCTGLPVTFTATPVNGGSPTYQWKKGGVNVGTNSATYTLAAPANGDVITCVMTTCSGSPTSNAITMTVTSSSAPTCVIAVSAGNDTTCAGVPITFTATPTNGGTTPSYQWKKGGVNVGTNSSTFTLSSPANGDVITCVMTSNSSCASPTTATSNAITVTVSATVAPTVSIAITAGTNPLCAGSSITFTATPTNGGNAPAYQWKKNGTNTATGAAFTSVSLLNNDVITCVLTSNSSCASPTTATSNAVTMTVNNVPTISQNGNVLTSSASTSYQWYKNGQPIAGATSQTYTVTSTGTYSVVVAGNGCQSGPKNVIVSGIYDVDAAGWKLAVYPNPANSEINISFAAGGKDKYKLEMKNVLGASVYSEVLEDFLGLYSKQIDVSSFAKGTYVISLSDFKNEIAKRIVVY